LPSIAGPKALIAINPLKENEDSGAVEKASSIFLDEENQDRAEQLQPRISDKTPSPHSSPRWGEEVYGKNFLKEGFSTAPQPIFFNYHSMLFDPFSLLNAVVSPVF